MLPSQHTAETQLTTIQGESCFKGKKRKFQTLLFIYLNIQTRIAFPVEQNSVVFRHAWEVNRAEIKLRHGPNSFFNRGPCGKQEYCAQNTVQPNHATF